MKSGEREPGPGEWLGLGRGRPERGERWGAAGLGASPETGPSVYEAVTRQMVESMTDELREIRSRLNGLLFMVAGALLIDLALRLMGAG